jgi:hypothetical protein
MSLAERFDTLVDNAESGKGLRKVTSNITVCALVVGGLLFGVFLAFVTVWILIAVVTTFGWPVLALPLGFFLGWAAVHGSSK